MSVEQLAVVLHHSEAVGTDKLVLLGIANHSGDGGAWPAVSTLARYANTTARTVQRSIGRLVDSGELVRYVQGGGLAGWSDHTRPNRYDVTVTCPDWCDHSANHRPRDGWAWDDAGNVIPVELPLSTGDTPDVPNLATRREQGVTPTSGGDAHVRGGVTPASPEPSINQPDPAEVPAPTTDREAGDAGDVSLSTVRKRLHQATEMHHRRERGEAR